MGSPPFMVEFGSGGNENPSHVREGADGSLAVVATLAMTAMKRSAVWISFCDVSLSGEP